ncbi:uncharacterized protein RJT20DRAFT_128856 [Scheffersomyces xylosifermentans]|uniref:uncharacterized protein n=1 Tax=Scheffersomyces xylosifermentans TaxID=1304137 RepID=UPI00315D77DE
MAQFPVKNSLKLRPIITYCFLMEFSVIAPYCYIFWYYSRKVFPYYSLAPVTCSIAQSVVLICAVDAMISNGPMAIDLSDEPRSSLEIFNNSDRINFFDLFTLGNNPAKD